MAKIIWRPPNADNGKDAKSVGEGQQRSIVATDFAGKDDKLEVKYDGAWYAADLTLREDGTITVHFEGFDSDEDAQWSAEKFNSLVPLNQHVRVVSEQLQDDNCGIISVNSIVCALRRSQEEDGWYDAIVTELRKNEHNSDACNCKYTVTWQDGPAYGQTQGKLTCGELCVPSTKNVETHPLIKDILRYASGEGRAMGQAKKRGPDIVGRDDKLEVKSDGAWFTAELTLRENGTIKVHFEGFGSERDRRWQRRNSTA